MSQTNDNETIGNENNDNENNDNETTITTPTGMSPEELLDLQDQAKLARIDQGKSVGPCYSKHGQPARWFHQAFGRNLKPAGSVSCGTALRVGNTNGALACAVVASAHNEDDLTFAVGATITATLLHSDKEFGDYDEVGPTICVKAPTNGITAEPGELIARFALGDFDKPWLKIKLEFSGTISTGNIDAILDIYPG